jgi:hypothetical protein
MAFDVSGILREVGKAYKRTAPYILPVALFLAVPQVKATFNPHGSVIKRIKAYYPWKVLEPKHLLTTYEIPHGENVPPEQLKPLPCTNWAWLWIEGDVSDVASFMVISDRGSFYNIAFCKADAGPDADKFTVEIDGIVHKDIYVYAERGLTAININK